MIGSVNLRPCSFVITLVVQRSRAMRRKQAGGMQLLKQE